MLRSIGLQLSWGLHDQATRPWRHQRNYARFQLPRSSTVATLYFRACVLETRVGLLSHKFATIFYLQGTRTLERNEMTLLRSASRSRHHKKPSTGSHSEHSGCTGRCSQLGHSGVRLLRSGTHGRSTGAGCSSRRQLPLHHRSCCHGVETLDGSLWRQRHACGCSRGGGRGRGSRS